MKIRNRPGRTDAMRYREQEPRYHDLWDWDIVLFHGDIRLMGQDLAHLDHCAARLFGANCSCLEGPKLTSPIVDKNQRRLHQDFYNEEKPGDGRVLLDAQEGDEIEVLSGKTYRLRGPRREQGYDSFARASIWFVYRDKLDPEEPKGVWSTLQEWLPWNRKAV